MSTDKARNVLFLCTGNSARSIMAEAILNRLGDGKFRGFSAGSQPKGEVHPLTIDLLKSAGYPLQGLRSKSWDEFAGPDAPRMDFVFTVCDSAANESCPIWPGRPISAHWGIPDPALARGRRAERRLAFANAYGMLSNRIGILVSLPLASLDETSLRRRLRKIGATSSESAREPEMRMHLPDRGPPQPLADHDDG